MKSPKDPNAGHRERIRKKYLKHGIDVFQDYEILELLLGFSISQKDMKPIAKALITKFKNLQGVLDATKEELLEIKGIGEIAATGLKITKDCATKYLQQVSENDFSPENITNLINYCKLKIGNLKDEEIRMFSLNSNFKIIGEDKLAEGTIDQAAVYPRKVVEVALKNKAASLIFCHNHPDGNVEPSEYDKTMTKALQLAAKTVNIQIFDHLIVSAQHYFSFREHQLL